MGVGGLVKGGWPHASEDWSSECIMNFLTTLGSGKPEKRRVYHQDSVVFREWLMESKVFCILLVVKLFCLWAFSLSYAISVVLPDNFLGDPHLSGTDRRHWKNGNIPFKERKWNDLCLLLWEVHTFFLTRKGERMWVQRNSASRRGAEVTFHPEEGHRIITELDRESEHLIFTFDYDT